MDKRTINRLATQAYTYGFANGRGRAHGNGSSWLSEIEELVAVVKGTQAERVVNAQIGAGFAHGLAHAIKGDNDDR